MGDNRTDPSQIEWEDKYRAQVIEETTKQLDDMRKLDSGFNLALCEHMLDTLYANQGDSWIGKGYLMELKEAARITAYELYILHWKEEIEEQEKKQEEAAAAEKSN